MNSFSVLLFFLIVLLLYSCVVSYYCIKFSLILLKLQDEIEESLDYIDKSILVFNGILEKPIFFDSIEIRQCMSEIKKVRTVIVNIAYKLTSISSEQIEDEKIEREEESQKDS